MSGRAGPIYDRIGASNFDDVTSIKTEQFKMSGREHLIENHLFSKSQSRESLPVMSNMS